MKSAVSLVAVAATFVTLQATTALARPVAPAAARTTQRWSNMTVEQKLTVVNESIRAERSTVRWWFHSIHRYPTGLITGLPHCPALDAAAPGMICKQAQRLVKALHVKARLVRQLLPRVQPIAHLALWECIHGHEASDWQNRDTGHNGHYGGLQMHPGWGYGTSYYASDDSAEKQMHAAEEGYRASGYSLAWLLGQWYHPDCARFA